MWVALAVVSAVMLGIYDIFKKLSVDKNNVLSVLFYNTLFCALLMLPVIGVDFYDTGLPFGGSLSAHLLILIKSAIVLASWVLGYFSLKHLPLTITGPISATRPVFVLIGAVMIFCENLNIYQWLGAILGIFSLYK